ncbi:MAG: extracellular solute-binding protein [Chloroflexi bacterium]|nr:extracellular solute-binding protein [Chloroflexota bacterium]
MSNKGMSRRSFLKLAGAAAAATAIPVGGLNKVLTANAQTALTVQLRSSFIPTNNELLTALLNDYAARNGLELDLSLLNHQQMAETLTAAAASGAGPDVLETVDIKPHQFADVLADVSDICEEIGEANGGWYPVARDLCVVDGVWRAMPHFLAAHAMVYREDLLSEAGYDAFPGTWDEVLTMGTELKSMGFPLGFALGHAGGDGNNFVYSVLWSFGAAVTDEAGVVNLDTPETRQACEFMQQLYNDAMIETVLAWDDSSNNRAFIAGEISVTNNASSILWVGRRDQVEFVDAISHASYPAGPAGLVQFLELNTIEILNFSESIEEAKGLLSFINSPEVWLPLGPDGFAFIYPLLQNYENHPAMPWNTDPKLAAFKGLAATGKALGYPGTPSAEASEVAASWIINDMFANVASGESIDDAVSEAHNACLAIYGQD